MGIARKNSSSQLKSRGEGRSLVADVAEAQGAAEFD